MADIKPLQVRVKFPGDLDYIPAVRKFFSEVLQVCKFSSKFAFRSEIIIDETCNNAVTYGCRGPEAVVEAVCDVYPERVELQVRDSGGRPEDLKRLRASMKKQEDAKSKSQSRKDDVGLGLEIVRMLSEVVDLDIDEDNRTSLRVVRLRNEAVGARKKTGS
jgi:serine/threonine-protein kinase RsbW